MNSTSGLPTRPLSVKEISDRAQAFDVNTNIPLKAWLRTAHTLNNEVSLSTPCSDGLGVAGY